MKKETRGRKSLPEKEKKVTINFGVKARHLPEVKKIIERLKEKYG